MAGKKKSDFLKETISKDLKEAEVSDLGKKLDVKDSFTAEINPEQRMRKIKKKKKFRLKLLLTVIAAIILVLVVGGVFAYFFYVSPFWISKPFVEKIELNDTLTEDHINYIANEIGVYKLHSAPLGGTSAQIELSVTDIAKSYTITVQDRKPVTLLGDASDPDIRIHLDEETLFELYRSEEIVSEAKAMVDAGEIEIEPVKDESVLASKGYKVLYDRISGEKIRGSSLLKMSSGLKRLLYFIAVVIVAGIGSWYLIRTRKSI